MVAPGQSVRSERTAHNASSAVQAGPAEDDLPGDDNDAIAERFGQRIVVFVVVAALVGTWAVRDRPLSAAEITAVVLATLGYGGLARHGVRRNGRSRARVVTHLLAQFALVGVILVVFARAGAFGSAWLLVMPPVAEATMALPMPWAVAAAACGLALVTLQAWIYGGAPVAIGALLPMGFGLAFVVLFSRLVRREAAARAASEALRADLAEANRHLAAHAAEVESLATERERTRLAGEIHDGLGHVLTVATVQIEAALATLDRDPAAARAALGRAAALTRQGLGDVRRAVAALRATPLDGKHLDQAVESLCAATVGAGGVDVSFHRAGAPRDLEPQVEHTLYRAAQEALTNVHDHARASTARVALTYDDCRVVLEVVDDGVGLSGLGGAGAGPDPEGRGPEGRGPEPRGFGLLGIERRAAAVGGHLAVESAGGAGGTRLRLEVPT